VAGDSRLFKLLPSCYQVVLWPVPPDVSGSFGLRCCVGPVWPAGLCGWWTCVVSGPVWLVGLWPVSLCGW
jgi:hypothetical protein